MLRAIGAVFSISWQQALELIRPYHAITVNLSLNYGRMFREHGFIRQPTPKRGAHLLTAAEFCKELDERLHHGERIFASVSPNHATAILPCICEDGKTRYKVVDSWDCSGNTVKNYWIHPGPGQALPEGMLNLEGESFACRPYGKGKIEYVCGYADNPEVLVVFPDGTRRIFYYSRKESA